MPAYILSRLILSVAILTGHVDNNRTSWNPNESTLSPSNVSTITWLGSYQTGAGNWGQPLYAPGVEIGGLPKNLIVDCTSANACFAFDADNPGSTALWSSNLGISTRTIADGDLYNLNQGCLATPVIDQTNNRLFAVCASSAPAWVLFSINLSTGAVTNSVVVTGSAVGTGDPVGGDLVASGTVTFFPLHELMRPALTLANGNVYVFAGSFGDSRPWHGWAFAYDELTLSQVGSLCTTPNGFGGAIWASGGGAAVDGSGNLYVATGNGDWDGASNFSDSILKLSPTLSVLDWFTPSNWSTMNAGDEDLAANRVYLIPGTSSLIASGKDLRVFLLSTANLGHLQGTGVAPQQIITTAGSPGGGTGAFGGAWMNNTFYLTATGASIAAYTFSAGTFNTTPVATHSANLGFPGFALLSASSSGASNGLIWALTPGGSNSASQGKQAGVLRALDASMLSELWNSSSTVSPGVLPKFAAPTVASGRIYVSNLDGQIQVYGIAPPNNNQPIDNGSSNPTRPVGSHVTHMNALVY